MTAPNCFGSFRVQIVGFLQIAQRRGHGFLGRRRIVGSVANLSLKSEKSPKFDHFIFESGGVPSYPFHRVGRVPRPLASDSGEIAEDEPDPSSLEKLKVLRLWRYTSHLTCMVGRHVLWGRENLRPRPEAQLHRKPAKARLRQADLRPQANFPTSKPGLV